MALWAGILLNGCTVRVLIPVYLSRHLQNLFIPLFWNSNFLLLESDRLRSFFIMLLSSLGQPPLSAKKINIWERVLNEWKRDSFLTLRLPEPLHHCNNDVFLKRYSNFPTPSICPQIGYTSISEIYQYDISIISYRSTSISCLPARAGWPAVGADIPQPLGPLPPLSITIQGH